MSKLLERLLAIVLCLLPAASYASGPRWVTGKPYYPLEGVIVTWYTNNPRYYTDPGNLSPYVSHTAADAIVAAAAGAWNVPMASLTLAYGGTLDEDASSFNIYPTGTGLVFPADIQSANYLNKPIAILYDYDGSITDLMLGSGASSPSSCRQNAVTESVDSISTTGKIQHAILVLNGRCTGPAPEQQLQLQYQLMRAFGRILGLAWSQTNDNVFTGTPTPTIQQALRWPIMHPIDILCGPYSYQCLPQPFTLRDDDIASLTLLYPVTPQAPVAGKTDSLARASRVRGKVTFPDGQGMQGVNVVVHRLQAAWNVPEAWETTSAVSGSLFRRRSSTPINTITSSFTSNMGTSDKTWQGYYDIFRTPIIGTDTWQNLVLSTQTINPLYTGPYAVGPYDSKQVAPSGSSLQQMFYVTQSYSQETVNFSIPDAVSGCQTAQSGTESAPASVSAAGWWTGNLCTYGYAAWSTVSMRANRSATVEVTSLDENSSPTSSKAMPVIGLWNATDSVGTLPTIASTPAAFNGVSLGTTSLTTQTSQARQLRIAIMDQRGDGRPDFAYQARVLYADSVTPTVLPAKGGAITINGMGFRAGNIVTINGVPTSVSSWTANTITAIAPSQRSNTAVTADVTIRDLASGGTTTMTAALTYQAPLPDLTLLSTPSGLIFTGIASALPFAVKALAADGTTPLADIPVTFSASGPVRFEACGQSTCTLTTNFQGIASTYVTPLSPGPITLSAASGVGTVTTSITALRRIQAITALQPELYLASNGVLTWTPQVSLSDNAASPIGVPVQWTAISGPLTFHPPVSSANSQFIAQTSATAGPLALNTQASVTACAWTSVCTSFVVNSVEDHLLQLQTINLSNVAQSLDSASTFSPVVFLVTDAFSHPVAGASVTAYQTTRSWTPPCPDQGRCPISPVDSRSNESLIAGLDGTVTFSPAPFTRDSGTLSIAAATGTQGFVSFMIQKKTQILDAESPRSPSASK
ncbi:IPT/TIG domain-containing protein [Edaphobacter albus]|uniref:IPT/TIG domain-containing protein n=1 Tax=Edaphobacter sp. 4G125 TaxID=2763071 RepID=UPI001C999B0E|nr:IPT/TIG domain-containing protein [Edaphobacter sp. 4G125]